MISWTTTILVALDPVCERVLTTIHVAFDPVCELVLI